MFYPHIRSVVLSAVGVLATFGAPVGGRYLYVVNCDAQIDKLDTVTESKVLSYNLAARTGKLKLIPTDPGVLDGCLAYQARYDPAAAVFYIVAPKQVRQKSNGTKDYLLLGFSLPRVLLVKQVSAGKGLPEPPSLDDLVPYSGGVRPDSARLAKLDVSTLAPDHQQIQNQVLESSGDRYLVRLFTADPQELVLAVANLRTKQLTRLQTLPATTALKAHLAPGGSHVMVETSDANRLLLYDSTTGHQVKELAAALIAGKNYLAIAPDGKAVYRSANAYQFIKLGLRFSPVAVWHPDGVEASATFFADR